MKTIQCSGCGAKLQQYGHQCSYCGAPLFIGSPLSDDTKTQLITALKGWENALKAAKDNNDRGVMGGCLLSFATWAAIAYLTYRLHGHSTFTWIAAAILAVVLFAAFGFVVDYYETKSVREVFDQSLRTEIEQHLQHLDCSKTDFKQIAFEVLEPQSWLYKVLPKL